MREFVHLQTAGLVTLVRVTERRGLSGKVTGLALAIVGVAGMAVSGGSTITMVANDAGGGTRLVDECNYDNNTSSVII